MAPSDLELDRHALEEQALSELGLQKGAALHRIIQPMRDFPRRMTADLNLEELSRLEKK